MRSQRPTQQCKHQLLLVIVIAALLPYDHNLFVRSEERSINFGSSVSTFDASNPYVIARLTNENFYSTGFTDQDDTNGGGLKEFSNHMAGSQRVHTVFSINIPFNDFRAKLLENTKILLGTDTTPLSRLLTECLSGIYEGGFKVLSQACRDGVAGNVLTFRRETFGAPNGYFGYVVGEIVLSQSPNLLSQPGDVIVTYSVGHTTAISTGLGNLFTNFLNRSPNKNRNAYFDGTYSEADYESCYEAICKTGCSDTKFSLIVIFNQKVFVHHVLFVLDTLNENVGTVNSFDVYVIAEDETETSCGTFNTNSLRGFQAWCNLEAKSFRIEGTPTNSADWEVRICSIGAFGTIYVHEIAASLSLQKGQSAPQAYSIDHIRSRSDVQITNDLNIYMRQKVDTTLSWLTVSNEASAAKLNFDVNLPLGKHSVTLETIDLNSPLTTKSVLRTDQIDLCIYSTNQEAFDCGSLTASGQIHKLSTSYEIHSGNLDISLPVIEHIPGFTKSQELQLGILTLSNGIIQKINTGDTATLARIGVSIETLSDRSTLKIDLGDKAYYDSNLVLTIRDFVVEEPTWSNTSQVSIDLNRPPCPVTKEILASYESNPVQILQAMIGQNSDSFDFSVLQRKADEVFKVVEEPYCGKVKFEFVQDADQPFQFDQSAQKFILGPVEGDFPGSSINYSAQFYFEDFPDRIWKVPISLIILSDLKFENELGLVTLQAGEKSSWTLPKVIGDPNDQLPQIIVDLDTEVQQFLSYNKDDRTMVYNGEDSATSYEGDSILVKYTIVDSLGNKSNPFYQEVSILEKNYEETERQSTDQDQSQLMEESQDQSENTVKQSDGQNKANTKEESQGKQDAETDVIVFSKSYEDFLQTLRAQAQERMQSAADGNRLPEVRVGKSTNFQTTRLILTQAMNFPRDLKRKINNQTTLLHAQQQQITAKNEISEQTEDTQVILQVIMINGESQEVDKNLQSWLVEDVTPTSIDISYKFLENLKVSQYDEADVLTFNVCLQGYFSFNGDEIPGCQFKQALLPRQALSQQEGESLVKTSSTVSSASAGTGVAFSLTGLLTGGPLSLLWGLINTLQLIVFYQMVKRQKFPSNVIIVNKALIDVATFDFLPADEIADQVFFLPEREPISLGSSECGFETPFSVLNLGTIQWIGWFKITLALLYMLTPKCVCKEKILGQIKWNGLIRFFYEAYLDILMAAVIDLYLADWSSPFDSTRYSSALSIFLLILTSVVTIAAPIFYACKRESWSKPEFQAKFGSLLSEYEVSKANQWPIVAMIFLHMLRRAIFVMLVVFMSNAQPIQVFLIQLPILATVGITLKTNYLYGSRQQKFTQIFNEFTLLMTSYFLHLFTDLIPDPMNRHYIGDYFNGFILANIILQLVLMIVTSILRIKLWCRKRYVAQIKQTWQQTQIEHRTSKNEQQQSEQQPDEIQSSQSSIEQQNENDSRLLDGGHQQSLQADIRSQNIILLQKQPIVIEGKQIGDSDKTSGVEVQFKGGVALEQEAQAFFDNLTRKYNNAAPASEYIHESQQNITLHEIKSKRQFTVNKQQKSQRDQTQIVDEVDDLIEDELRIARESLASLDRFKALQ